MILSDRDIAARLAAGDLVVEPLDDPDLQLQPASVDVRLGPVFRRPATSWTVLAVDAPLPRYEEAEVEPGGALVLAPGDFVLGATVERVRLPHDLVAVVNGRSSLGRLGVVVHVTAGYVDPGFDGQITLELANVGANPVRLRPGARVAQLVFQRMTSPCARPYGAARGSKYVGDAARGPVASRIAEDAAPGARPCAGCGRPARAHAARPDAYSGEWHHALCDGSRVRARDGGEP